MIQKNVFHGLKLGNDTLKQLNKEVSIEAVGKLMDETSDAVQYQNVGGNCQDIKLIQLLMVSGG